MKSYKELPESLTKKGFKYTTIASTGAVRLCEVMVGGRVVGYELGKRKYRNPTERFGESLVEYDKIETFWKDEDFGSIAWAYPPDKAEALQYFKNLSGDVRKPIGC